MTDGAPRHTHGAGFLLERLGTMAEQEWKTFISAEGLTTAQFTVLTVLAETGPITQREVARRATVDPRNIVPTIAGLTARELILADADPSDRRAKVIRLSPTGTRRLAAITDRLRAERSDFFAPLSPTEYEQLSALLDRVYRARVGSLN